MTPAVERIANAWKGRVTGCLVGKPVEMLSMTRGHDALSDYLRRADALPLRDYVPLVGDPASTGVDPSCCRDELTHAVPDDDINYTVLALLIIEQYGLDFTTADVGRAWLRHLPGAMTFTAEREAYVELLGRAGMGFSFGAEPDFDLAECSDNPYNDWIGAQIRADLYGWISPGEPGHAADMAARDAALSHRGDGVLGAKAVAAMAAAIPATASFGEAVESAMKLLPPDSDCVTAMEVGMRTAIDGRGPEAIHHAYDGMSPVHTVNNLALVVWGLLRGEGDYAVAVGDTVAAGWDTDCNGATVGGLWGLTGRAIPEHLTRRWRGRVRTSLAGTGELDIDDLIRRTTEISGPSPSTRRSSDGPS